MSHLTRFTKLDMIYKTEEQNMHKHIFIMFELFLILKYFIKQNPMIYSYLKLRWIILVIFCYPTVRRHGEKEVFASFCKKAGTHVEMDTDSGLPM